MKPAVIFSILIPCIGLLSFAQSHSIEKRSLKFLLGGKALLLKKKLGLLGLGELAGHADGDFGYAGGYDHQIYGGHAGGVQLGGLWDKKLSLLGLKGSAPQSGGYVKGGYENGGYVNGVYANGGYVNGGYADGYPHIHHNHDYSSQIPEKVVIVKVVSDGSSNAGSNGGSYDSGYNGVYGSGYNGGYNRVYNIYPNSGVYGAGVSGHKVVSGHVGYDYNHDHYPGC